MGGGSKEEGVHVDLVVGSSPSLETGRSGGRLGWENGWVVISSSQPFTWRKVRFRFVIQEKRIPLICDLLVKYTEKHICSEMQSPLLPGTILLCELCHPGEAEFRFSLLVYGAPVPSSG